MTIKTIGRVVTVFTLLWIGRITLSGSNRYGFMVLNICLATVPLLAESGMRRMNTQTNPAVRYVGLGFLAAVWLLFLPNAFYILTDFMHLNGEVLVNARDDGVRSVVVYARGDVLYLYDSLLLLGATVFGAYAGGLALSNAYAYGRKVIGAQRARLCLLMIMVLGGVGVYVGRYGRWNSWEGFTHPYGVMSDIVRDALSSPSRARILGVTWTVLLFELASLWAARNIRIRTRAVEVSAQSKRSVS